MSSTVTTSQRPRGGLRRLLSHRPALGGIITLALIVVAGVLAPFLAPYGMNQALDVGAYAAPSPDHWFGTDGQGRDVLTRLIWGARVAIPSALLPALIAGPVGLLIGTIAGQSTGVLREVLMRLIDVGLAFPIVLLAIAIAGVVGGGFWTVTLAIAVALTPYMARVAFSVAQTVRASDYVIAAQVSGASPWQIVRWEMLPNVAPAVVVYLTSIMGPIMVVASGLSFFGLGAAPPAADWGQMISDGRVALSTAPLVCLAPGAMIVTCALSFTFIGDGVRDVLDPHR